MKTYTCNSCDGNKEITVIDYSKMFDEVQRDIENVESVPVYRMTLECPICDGTGEVTFKKVKIEDGCHGDLMTMQEWLECVECGGFIDYDGSGSYSDGEYLYTGMGLLPSDVERGKVILDFSHVMWYNR